MAKQYTYGQLINVFYHDGTSWKTFYYTQNHSLSLSNETTNVSSKDNGLHPFVEVTGSSWSISGECYFTKENVATILGMQEKATPFSFAIAKVNTDDHASGLKDVTGLGSVEDWTIGTDFVKYGEGIVTSASITANNSEVASISIEITGSGALTSTAPTAPKSYTEDSDEAGE